MLYMQMVRGDVHIERTVHEENASLLLRMCDEMGYLCEVKNTDVKGWLLFFARRDIVTLPLS